MTIIEKYPKDIPWDLDDSTNQLSQKKWILKNNENVYTFNRNLVDSNYIFIKKNNEIKKSYKEYKARFTFQRLFDNGYELSCVDSPFCCF